MPFRPLLLPILALTSGGAAAAQPAFGDIDVSANVGIVSDYRFRGISLSDRDPALQGGIDLSDSAGWFVGTWASTIAEYGGADVELDLYGGYANSVAGLDYALTAYFYLYPGGEEDVNYVELQGTLGRSFGDADVSVELSYVPTQKNIGGDNVYVGASFKTPIAGTPLSFLLRSGYEDGFYEDKLDAEAGLSWTIEPVTLGVSYVASNYSGEDEAGRNAADGIYLSVLAEF